MSVKENISQIEIPHYSKKEELFNSISHLFGLPVAFFIIMFSLNMFLNGKINLFYFIGLLIFGLSATIVYLISSIYHYLNHSSYYKKVFRIIDHCAIYLLIAGTYTPICFVLSKTTFIGVLMLIIEWVGAFIGIVMKAFLFKHKSARIMAFLLYIVMGWLALFCCAFLYMSRISFAFILLGGITYTIGSILYAIGHKNLSFHSVFHVFVLISTIIQTIGVFILF